jgi:hypothetical protein
MFGKTQQAAPGLNPDAKGCRDGMAPDTDCQAITQAFRNLCADAHIH